jgi:DNA-binding IscR family transcriptional regulator
MNVEAKTVRLKGYALHIATQLDRLQSGAFDLIHLAHACGVTTQTFRDAMEELQGAGLLKWYFDKQNGAVGWEIL